MIYAKRLVLRDPEVNRTRRDAFDNGQINTDEDPTTSDIPDPAQFQRLLNPTTPDVLDTVQFPRVLNPRTRPHGTRNLPADDVDEDEVVYIEEGKIISNTILLLKNDVNPSFRILVEAIRKNAQSSMKNMVSKLGRQVDIQLQTNEVCAKYWFMAHNSDDPVLWAMIVSAIKPRDIKLLCSLSSSEYLQMDSGKNAKYVSQFKKNIWNSSGVILITRQQTYFDNCYGNEEKFSPKIIDKNFSSNILLFSTYSSTFPTNIESILAKYNIDSKNILHIPFVVGLKNGKIMFNRSYGVLNTISHEKNIKVFLIDFSLIDSELISHFIRKYDFRILTSVNNKTWLFLLTDVFESKLLDEKFHELGRDTPLIENKKRKYEICHEQSDIINMTENESIADFDLSPNDMIATIPTVLTETEKQLLNDFI
tara:strand:+ start:1360 stop:2625 length:1266 start_codon:yes stop_codon:yes gene_type:complete